MSALPLSSFRSSPFCEIVIKSKPETFKDFLNSIWTDIEIDRSDTQPLVNAACEKFGFGDVHELIEFADARLSPQLKDLFLEVTQSFHFEPSRLIEIRALLESEIKKPSDPENGINQCVAMWLMGAFEGAFHESYDYLYLSAFYRQGATLPLFNGQIPEYSSTQIKTETEYKDRVIFSVLINDQQVLARKAISSLGLFSYGDLSEFGNILRTDVSLFGLGKNDLVYNQMRMIIQQHFTVREILHWTEYVQFNPRFFTNTDTLQQIHEKYPDFNVAEEFDKTLSRLTNMLPVISLSAIGMIPPYLHNCGSTFMAMLCKDYQFIEHYLDQYCSEPQIDALRKTLVQSCYLIYKDILQTITRRPSSFHSVEYVVFELLPFFENLVEQLYGPENHMVHVVFAIRKLHQAISQPSTPVGNSEMVYWGSQPKIYDDLDARKAFQTAAKAGSISARLQLKRAFSHTKKDTAQNLQTAMDWDLEGIRNKNSLGSIGITYDFIGLFVENQNNAGDHSGLVRDYIREKVVSGDLGFPEFTVHVIEEFKQAAQAKNRAINFDNPELSPETLDAWRDFICNIFPFLKNRMLTHKDISAECAFLTLCGELGSSYATLSLNSKAKDDVFYEMLAPVCASLETLTNPKNAPYYLMTDNWFRFTQDYSTEDCQNPKNAIRIIHYIDRMFLLFEEFEAHVQSILDKGQLPSIQLVGVGVNFIQYLFHLSKLMLDLEKAFDRHIYRETTEQIFKFWSDRYSMDANAASMVKLSDLITRPNRLIYSLIRTALATRTLSTRTNVLCNPITPHAFLEAMNEYSPSFDSPMGIIYTIYLIYIEKVLYEAMGEQNHVECLNINIYAQYLHSLIVAHSNVFSDITQAVKNNSTDSKPAQLDLQNKAKAMASNQTFIENNRKILANTKSLEDCVLDLKQLVLRGSAFASEIYHQISVSNLNGRENFLPFDSMMLQCCMNILSQRPMVEYLTRRQQQVAIPYMSFNLFLYDEEESKFLTEDIVRCYLLKTLVSYGDIFSLAYDAHTAAISPNKISMIGTKFEDAIIHLKSVLATNKSVIQLLESAKHEYSYKFIQSKQKFKIQDITPKDWLSCFLLSSSANFLSE